MARKLQAMDGNTAAAHISYAFTEFAGIFPITPSTPMAETVDEWAAHDRINLFGKKVVVQEMQSEAGAAGTVHGALKAGALTTTYTASQGLLLMVPNMYKIAGELLPTVFHVSARAITTNALNIFGDHSDVMAARQTGFAMLAQNSVQEVMDLAAVAHLASLESSVPFINFFDGFRTSHEINKVEVIEQDELRPLLNLEALENFRKRAMNPEHPTVSGTNQNPDFYFQQRETVNKHYEAVPAIVKKYMNEINKLRGTNYDVVNYTGAQDATELIVIIGSGAQTVEQTVEHLNAQGRKVGMLTIRLYRPFPTEDFINALPKSVENIAVLDRTKEPGAQGDPLLLDVQSAIFDSEFAGRVNVIGGRYGIGSKDFLPNQVVAIFDEAAKGKDAKKRFTVGITDDVTGTSLEVGPALDFTAEGTFQGKFWGFGSDGTVGANKSAIKLIGNYTDKYVQGYFSYDSKKSGGLTVSHLRFGDTPITSTYLISAADFISCSTQAYVKQYPVVQGLKDGGIFLLNTIWSDEDLEKELPASMKAYIAKHNVKFYTINAVQVARDAGLGGRTNTAMQTAFFKLNPELLGDKYAQMLKDDAHKSYAKKSMAIVEKNQAAIQAVADSADIIHEVQIPQEWANLDENANDLRAYATPNTPGIDNKKFAKEIMEPLAQQQGDLIPVSKLIDNGMLDGTMPLGTSALEKRAVATHVPHWNPEKCIGCNECAFVCPHAAIRPVLVNDEDLANAPEGFIVKELKGSDGLSYRIQVSVEDCTGCGLCIQACPVNKKIAGDQPIAITNPDQPLGASAFRKEAAEAVNWAFAMTLKEKVNPSKLNTVRGSQFQKPLLEFSGACAGCGETPYVKLLTQLFGDRMTIANATGCSSIWGAAIPAAPFTTNDKGYGVAWSNSLFEDNAEFGLGIFLANKIKRQALYNSAKDILGLGDNATACGENAMANATLPPHTREALQAWAEGFNDSEGNRDRAEALKAALDKDGGDNASDPVLRDLSKGRDLFAKPSQWIIGGDGWGYDIGYGGVDHVLASGEDVNILIMDNEVYSNTGGQASKATPAAAIAKFAAAGKVAGKKDIGAMAMTYGNVYVAQIASGANSAQALKAIREAEAYNGPSLIIAYTPCINHGLAGGMHLTLQEAKDAVESGYWSLYRFDPTKGETEAEKFQLDFKKPDFAKTKEFMLRQNRFSSLQRIQGDNADKLYDKTVSDARTRFNRYAVMSGAETV
ncbi:MAG: pyruvate:ferredoxin (flavodoxin) oxidoreductase [Candidatus Ancillula sp.]|jgi:pyruvate-ferredoxin/flavodoxin oxidoreductase|nr:pyruvate:ferredoxin (flavodoxin) oxidoreductase [Candidatus Ancillula sp.]